MTRMQPDKVRENLRTQGGPDFYTPGLFICLFIRDGMQLGSYGPLEKQIKMLRERKKERKKERTNNPKVMPSSPMNKCKMQK